MARKPHNNKTPRGSERWIQFFVNKQPEFLNHAIRTATSISDDDQITWRSPLADDEYAEYCDQDFLLRLGLTSLTEPLAKFWPNNGPHWDALASTSANDVILVEAKANVTELATTPTQATSTKSIQRIHDSISRVQVHMDVDTKRRRPELWANAFYQYANRIATLYYLRELNQIPAHLIFLNFINDPDAKSGAVKSTDEWHSLITLVEACLGIERTCPLMKHVHHIHIDVSSV